MKTYEEVADFIARRDPREVAGFKPSAEACQRVGELLEREKAARFTAKARRELDHSEDLEPLPRRLGDGLVKVAMEAGGFGAMVWSPGFSRFGRGTG